MIDLDEQHRKITALQNAIAHERDKIQHGADLPKAEDVVKTAEVFDTWLRG